MGGNRMGGLDVQYFLNELAWKADSSVTFS